MGPRLAVYGRLFRLSAGFSLPCGLALFLCNPAFAEWSVEAHLYTQHFIDMGPIEKNEKNFGLGLRYQFSENWYVLAGEYRNSLTTHELQCGSSACSWEPENIDSRYLSLERVIYRGETQFIKTPLTYEFGLGAGIADGYKEFINKRGEVFRKSEDYNFLGGPYLSIGGQYSLKFRYMVELASMSMQYTF